MFMLSPVLLASLMLLPPIAHVIFDCSLDKAQLKYVDVLFFKNLIDSFLQTSVFSLWGVSFLLTYSELLNCRRARVVKCAVAGFNRVESKHYASSLMMNLIIALIGVNLILWLPVIVINWLSLDVDIRTAHNSLLSSIFLFSISSKGIFHATAILYVLGRRIKDEKKSCGMEMKGIYSADTKPLYFCGNIKFPMKAKLAVRRKSGLYCPSPDYSASTVLDYERL